MARVITYSRTFPAYHPKAGQPTYFVEKFLRSIHCLDDHIKPIMDMKVWAECKPKHTTIRAGNRWKVGDKFSPRVWSGKPYNSKQIIIAPDVEIKKVWRFEMKPMLWADECQFKINGKKVDADLFAKIAKNDGLSTGELCYWFAGAGAMNSKRKPFTGQIICWNEEVNY